MDKIVCRGCLKEFYFNGKFIQESHDVPCYLFKGETRAERKNQADKFGRHLLCLECHKKYELALQYHLRLSAIRFSGIWFKRSYNDTSKT
jgi:hypothetical protein